MRGALRVWALVAAVALWGCGSGDSGGEASAPSAPPSAAKPAAAPPATADPGAGDAAQLIFSTRCFTCHGPEGAGDGPGSAALTPKPRDFRDASWQASVSDQHIDQIILYGGAAVGKSPSMPGNPDLMSKPEVVAALVAHVRSLSKP